MKNKKNLILSVFQLIIGMLAIITSIILYVTGMMTTKWIITFILGILFIGFSIIDIFDYKKDK